MKYKRGIAVLVIFMFLFSITLVLAQNETETDEVEQAYSCLKDRLEGNCGDTQSTEQAVFSLLAMAYDSSVKSDCKSSVNSKKSGDCWGATDSSSCDLKSTALAVIGLNHINANIDDYTDWLLDKRELTTDLDWFLEIDANEATACKIKVNNGNEKTFNIAENKKISGTSSCLSPAEQNYFLKISDSCLDDEFTISCDKDFITTLLYKKPGASIYYVSSETNSASASGNTEETVNAYCFETSNSCDYEGSLWAALALAKTGEDVSPYIPYITAMADETINKKYLPSAFLYMLTNEDDYYSELTDLQKQDKYWEEGGKKFYDTALALLALQNTGTEAEDNTKEYLFEIQDNSGCWNSNNIRDTSFILYAGWPKPPLYDSDTTGRADCEDFAHYCVSSGECSSDDTLDNFYCPFLSDVCCETQPTEQTCLEKQGFICEENQRCTGSEVIALDTNYCCLASCVEITENECEDAGYTCKSSCSDNEDEKFYDCDYIGDICCAEGEGGNYTLIILLVILIILIILAIVFRNQVKVWWFRIKSKLRFGKPKGPGPSGPGMPPIGGVPLMQVPRQILPSRPVHYPRRRRSPRQRSHVRTPRTAEKDTIFEDTMKKLKDMTK